MSACPCSACICEKPTDEPFDRLVIGEAYADAAAAADRVQHYLQRVGMNVECYVPIMDWRWCHVAMVLPLAGAVHCYDKNLDAVVAGRALLRRTIRATAEGLTAARRAGHTILPRSSNVMRFIPAALGAGRIATLLQSDFGRIAMAGHAAEQRDSRQILPC